MAQSNVLLQPMPATATEPAALAVVTEAAVTETAVTEAAVTETAVTEAAVTETAVTEAAVTETAVTEAVVTEAVAGSSAWWRHGDGLEPAFCLR